ncbi:unnamed protein product [Bathycoccus prasinos]
MRNLKDLNLKRWRLLSFHNGMSNYQEYLSNQGQIRMNSAKFFKKANVKVFAAPAEIYMAVLESKFLPFDEQVIQEYSQLSRKLDENNTIVTVRFKYDVQSIFKKNSGHCFLRTIYPREDGSYLISFQFSKTNMVEIFISSIFIFLTDILCVQVYSSTRGIEGFQLLYELSPSVIYCNGKINVISVVSCYIAIDGTEAYQIHDDLPMNFLGVLSSRLQNFNMKIEKARWQYGLHSIITETKSVINQSSAKVRISHYFKKYCNAKSIIFAINLQVPAGPRHFSLVFYYKIEAEVMEGAMIQNFVSCDDKYRNSRFKLIPNVSTGPWIVQSSVGRKPLIVGGALRVEYHKEAQYFEVDIDIGSSAIACSIVRFVLGYVRLLVVDLCFLIEAQSEEELPEKLLGSVRIIHLEPNSAIRCPN